PSSVRTVASDADERLVGFGTGATQVVLSHGGLDSSAGADLIERYEFVADQRRVVAQSSGDQGLQVEQIIPGSGRIFFERFDRAASTSSLFVEDSVRPMSIALTPATRRIEAFSSAPEGDRISVQLAGTTAQSEALVLDEESGWANVPVPTIYSATAMVTFFSNASRQGEIMSVPGQAGVLRIAARDSLGEWREVYTSGISWQKSADDTRAVLVASDGTGGGRVLSVDLRSENPEAQDRGGIATYQATILALSRDGRFLALDLDDHSKVLFDVASGVAHALPMAARDLVFDRLGRYLAYGHDGTSCDIHVLALDQIEDGPRVIARDCPGSELLWVD
ncbi:MAG TPA: hypothetical protein VHM19_19495, partial [Polyangiales bacterium]|nr:hypothetical protein [Polyangiales bacterium]